MAKRDIIKNPFLEQT